MAEISRRYIDKYWVVPVRKLFYFHHWMGATCTSCNRKKEICTWYLRWIRRKFVRRLFASHVSRSQTRKKSAKEGGKNSSYSIGCTKSVKVAYKSSLPAGHIKWPANTLMLPITALRKSYICFFQKTLLRCPLFQRTGRETPHSLASVTVLSRNAGTRPWNVFIASQRHWKWSDNVFPTRHSGKYEVCSLQQVHANFSCSSIQFLVRNAIISR